MTELTRQFIHDIESGMSLDELAKEHNLTRESTITKLNIVRKKYQLLNVPACPNRCWYDFDVIALKNKFDTYSAANMSEQEIIKQLADDFKRSINNIEKGLIEHIYDKHPGIDSGNNIDQTQLKTSTANVDRYLRKNDENSSQPDNSSKYRNFETKSYSTDQFIHDIESELTINEIAKKYGLKRSSTVAKIGIYRKKYNLLKIPESPNRGWFDFDIEALQDKFNIYSSSSMSKQEIIEHLASDFARSEINIENAISKYIENQKITNNAISKYIENQKITNNAQPSHSANTVLPIETHTSSFDNDMKNQSNNIEKFNEPPSYKFTCESDVIDDLVQILPMLEYAIMKERVFTQTLETGDQKHLLVIRYFPKGK